MAEGTGGSVEVKLDGAHLRVDARPARLVSLLRGAGDDPVLTAQREGGGTHTEAVPAAARQVTFQVVGDLSVEATRGSDFVALAEASGRQVVVVFNGEVTVLPTGESGDRFALGAHEALLVPGDGTDPRVVPSDSLSADDQDEISGAMEAAALSVTSAVDGPTADEPTQAVPAIDQPDATPAPTTTPVAATSGTASKAAGTTKKGPPVTPPQKRNNNKKGKRGRPQQAAKKQAPLIPAAAAGAVAAGAAAGAKKTGAVPGKKAAVPAKQAATKATTGRGGGGRGSGGGGHDDSYEDTPGDRRFILGAIVLAALVAIVLAVFVLTGDDDETDLATDGGTTTTEAEAETTTSAARASTTTAVAAATSAAPSPTTTAAPTTTAPATTTTTARATTTTAAAAVAKYGIEPKSCVQNANNSITYTATIKNDSTAAFDFTIRVVFKDASGASAASSDASVSKLDAGKSVDFTATGTPSRNLANAGNCVVERVDARPSGS